MERRYLTAVAPLPDHRLRMDFVSGVRLLPNDPAVWNSDVMGGIFVRIGHAEISHDGLPNMAEREHCNSK